MKAATAPAPEKALDWKGVKSDFPILSQKSRGKELVYLDTAASSQKPRQVIEAEKAFYEKDYANIHRGLYELSQRATQAYEAARARCARFLGAGKPEEIVFVRGATEGLNLVASSLGTKTLRPGDEVLVSHMEHHSNFVPWQMLCERSGARLRVAPVTDRGEIDEKAWGESLGPRTKIAAFCHVSNALGTVNPVARLARAAKQAGAFVVVDGAQAVAHAPVNVGELECDFYVFSGHKAYGPGGAGVLWGRWEALKDLPPYQGGGEMIQSVTLGKTIFKDPPERFEAGTPNIAGVVALAKALDYLEGLGWGAVMAHEDSLMEQGTRLLKSIPGLSMVGEAPQKAGVLSFVVEGVHPHDLGTLLDREGVAIRAGHHCAQPLMDRLGHPATARASLGVYNGPGDLEALAQAVEKAKKVFGV